MYLLSSQPCCDRPLTWSRCCLAAILHKLDSSFCILIVSLLQIYRISATTLASHPLVTASLAGLSSEETFDAAVDGTPPPVSPPPPACIMCTCMCTKRQNA